MAFDNMWRQKALISVSKSGGSEVTFHANTKDIKITMPPRDIAIENNTNGGQVVSYNPDGMWQIDFSGWVYDGIDVDALYADATAGTSVVNTFSPTRTPVRVTILWTTDSAAATSTAVSATSGSTKSRRMSFVKGYITDYPISYVSSDGKLMFDVTVKGPAHLSTGVGTITAVKVDGSIAALGAYTETDN